ncbi:MAG: septum site-determining protein MinC [Pseudomonadota bacterium]
MLAVDDATIRDSMSKNQTRKPLEIKISTVVAVAALIGDTDLDKLSSALAEVTGGTPDYFEDEFTVIDLGNLQAPPSPDSIAWSALIALFRSHRLNPVAVRNAPEALEQEIRAHGLSIDGMDQSLTFELTPPPSPPPSEPAPAPAPAIAPVLDTPRTPAVDTTASPAPVATKVIDMPVRSGQRVYARGGDLVILATVNPGAEVIADGSIHVYAPLRGRALAGAAGASDARIIGTCMEAELVSIAGVYRTFDDGWPKELKGKPVQVLLQEDRLDLRPMALK